MGKEENLAECLVSTRVCLRILATTDLHMQILPCDYHTGHVVDTQGLARTATLIHQARQETKNSILLDNGDFLCGTVTDAVIAKHSTDNHPMIRVMNQLGYDAITPGNHDFDQGIEFLQQLAAQANFPFVSANALLRRGASAPEDQGIFPGFIILEREVTDMLGASQRLHIGITGFLPPRSIAQHQSNKQPVRTRDIIEAARATIPQMKAAGADIIIALAHSGIGNEQHAYNMENAAVPLAALEGIDAIISGHRHRVFPGPGWPDSPVINSERGTIHGKPVVSAGFWGSHLGLIDLDLVKREGTWIVQHHKTEARPIFERNKQGVVKPRVKTDLHISKIIEPANKLVLDWAKQPIGPTKKPLNSFFAMAAPTHAVQAVQRAKRWYVEQYFADIYNSNHPLLASAGSFKAGGFGGPTNYTNIPVGQMTIRDISDLYPFPNLLVLLEIDGAGLREWLERAASVFNTACPNGPARQLKAAELPGYLFETVLGVEYEINLAGAARYTQAGHLSDRNAWRIRHLTYQGQPVEPAQKFTLITNNYRQGGGGFYPPSCRKSWIKTPATMLQDLLSAYFRAEPDPNPELEAHWNFTPVPGARMIFRSAPDALDHMDDLSGRDIQPLSRDAYGYQLFELYL